MTTARRAASAIERWIAWIRLGAVAFALFQIFAISDAYPPGYEAAAWATTAVPAAGRVAFFVARAPVSSTPSASAVARLRRARVRRRDRLGATCLIFSFEPGTPIRQLLFVAVVEAALRYGMRGGVVLRDRAHAVLRRSTSRCGTTAFGQRFQVDNVTFQVGVQVITGLIVGWLVERLRGADGASREARAGEAERLRDELGRRVDLLEAANRCARALGSSLDLEQAFSAFIRELRGLVPFDRTRDRARRGRRRRR